MKLAPCELAVTQTISQWRGLWIAGIISGIIAAPLLFGIEPVGGDPDRAYRPIKQELAKALLHGSLPHWSDRFGTGVPLVAESHAAAYYPLNWILYRLLDVAGAYRLSMWLHLMGCAAATAVYAHRCGVTPWGASLAGISFTFCGFQAIHASHEIFYSPLMYLPLCLWLSESYLESGRSRWIALLALSSGSQWTLGHFQIATWTSCLVILLAIWRVVADKRPWRRFSGLAFAVGLGGAIAAAQLWPSWQFTQFVGQANRSVEARSFYSFPPAHLVELALPRLFREIPGGPMAEYWWSQQTTGYEAALFIGTVPLILACIGAYRVNRELRPWMFALVGSLMLATMPQWWPQGYAMVLEIPGPGFFRAPARYTIIACFSLALLAGRGLDRACLSMEFRHGMTSAVVFVVLAIAWAAWWTSRSTFAEAFSSISAVARFGIPVVTWLISLGIVLGWRQGRWSPGTLVLLSSIELASLYYSTAVNWGWHVPVASSPVLQHLRNDGAVRIGGDLENLPVLCDRSTSNPYLGFRIPPPTNLLINDDGRPLLARDHHLRWSRRLGVTHEVWSGNVISSDGSLATRKQDRMLDKVVERTSDERGTPWTILRLPDPFPSARVVTHTHVSFDAPSLVRRLSLVDEPDVAHFLLADVESEPSEPKANRAELLQWNGKKGIIKHNGGCELIITRTYYPGWIALVNGVPRKIRPVDGGLQGVHLDGVGLSRIEVLFRPEGQQTAVSISLGSLIVAITLLWIDFRWSSVLRGTARGFQPLERVGNA